VARNLKFTVVFTSLPVTIRSMKRGHKTTICMLAGVLSGASSRALTPAAPTRPYEAIVDRNVFNLHPPPAAIDPAELARSRMQIPKLTLNGITTILGKKLVILTMPATKPGVPPITLMLAEEERQEEIEVKEIDEKAGVVKVTNHGEDQTLDFDHDGTRPLAAGANPGTPLTIPPIPAAPPPNVLPMPAPIRPFRTLQSRTTPLSGNAPQADTQDQPESLTPEQQTLIIEAQRLKLSQDGDPRSALFPITDRTAEMTDPNSGQEAPQ
jgi:hypothetical protein